MNILDYLPSAEEKGITFEGIVEAIIDDAPECFIVNRTAVAGELDLKVADGLVTRDDDPWAHKLLGSALYWRND